jgi:RimJ/RimL family protein N-acetyltransferase
MMNMTQEEAELAIRIGDKNYWGKGYGADAVSTLVNYWLSTGLRRIWLKVLPGNIRAVRCYEKCGFTAVARLILDGYEFLIMEISR